MGRLEEIQTVLKPLKSIIKTKLNFHNQFRTGRIIQNNEPARPDQARPDPTVTLFDGLFLRQYRRQGCEILIKSLFMLSQFGINIPDSLETMRFLTTQKFQEFSAFILFLLLTEREISNSDGFIGKIWFRSIRINPILNLKNSFLSIKTIFYIKTLKKCRFFLQLFQRFYKFL